MKSVGAVVYTTKGEHKDINKHGKRFDLIKQNFSHI